MSKNKIEILIEMSENGVCVLGQKVKPVFVFETQENQIYNLKEQIRKMKEEHEEQMNMFFRRVECSLEVGAFKPDVSGWGWQFPNPPTSFDEVVKNVAILRNEYCRVRDLRNALLAETDDIVVELESIANKIEELKQQAKNTLKDLKDQ